jgi:membrane fusion protein, multidrug efflux system
VPKDDMNPSHAERVEQAPRVAAPPAVPPQADNDSRRRRLRWGLIALGPLLVVIVGGWLYLTGGRYVSTDDAFIKTDLVPISAQVPGQVASVTVANNQHVDAGQVLFTLDAASYRAALDEAEANLGHVRDQIAALRANYTERQATLKSAEEAATYQQREYERQQRLRASGAVSEKQLDDARHNYEQAARNADAVRGQIAAILAQLGGSIDTPTEELPQYRAALAKRDDAQIALGRTVVKAPAAGVVANVTIRPGEYVAAGQPIFSLAELDHLWVEANFKETQLTHVADGQTATVTVDAYPGVTWNAKVESVSPASGNEFSVLPAQNSSGNWVKVVQRIPVRLAIAPQANAPQLRAGMSVDVEIDTESNQQGTARAAASPPSDTRG